MGTIPTTSNFLIALLSIVLFWPPEILQASDQHNNIVVAALVYGPHNVSTLEGFKAGMKEKGYIEGRNITYLFDGPYVDKKSLDAGMVKLITKKPDLVFSATTPATMAAQKATSKNKIPVVFGPVNNPAHSGIVKNHKQPGGNMTGIMPTDSTAKQIEWALKIAPSIKTILLPYNPDDKSSVLSLQKVTEATKMFKLELIVSKTHNHKEIDNLLANCPDGIDAIFLPRDGMIMSRVADFSKVAQQKKIVLSGTRFEMAEKGALFGFGFTGFELGKQMSRLADLILHGQNPGSLPVETAEPYLAINLKTANAMGLNIPEHILRQAHMIIRPE